jgi:hypothetical protein
MLNWWKILQGLKMLTKFFTGTKKCDIILYGLKMKFWIFIGTIYLINPIIYFYHSKTMPSYSDSAIIFRKFHLICMLLLSIYYKVLRLKINSQGDDWCFPVNPQTMMLGQEPRQTTFNLGHLSKWVLWNSFQKYSFCIVLLCVPNLWKLSLIPRMCPGSLKLVGLIVWL